MSSSRVVYTSLTSQQLQELLNDSSQPKIVIKFSAKWCKPCTQIKEFCEKQMASLPDTILIADIDIDETLDLYGMLKRKRTVSGIPTMLFYDGAEDHSRAWHIPDDSVSGTDQNEIQSFFTRCLEA